MARAMWRKRLDPDGVAEYVRLHADPWPELLAEIARMGIRNYSIFLDGSEVIGYFEHDDLAALGRHPRSEVMVRWNALIAPLSAGTDDGSPTTWPVHDLVFHVD